MATRRKYIPGDFILTPKRSSAGIGLFAGQDIPKDACVIEYVGREVPEAEQYTNNSRYLFGIGSKRMVDGKPKINKAGYINHSCAPNSEPIIHKGRIFIFSKKAIKAGDELTYDYGAEYFNDIIIGDGGCKCAKCAVTGKGQKKRRA
ncbi:MAG: histone-lysine N-methyltransferase MLL3 [Parcubacteria bacterium C7867-007]|nr:MAG: histone-lysine N-methyltransferase MLL3 [Parcubacteria bacterium C7867-007]